MLNIASLGVIASQGTGGISPLVLSGSPPEATVGQIDYYFKFTRTGGSPSDITAIEASAAWTDLQAHGFAYDGTTDELTASEVLA